ncbi:MAG: hypothetical protein OEY55_10290 [Acidimicrobiia bacterium]|nr:hypothetical protein [Acidimicrobiia bacterium]
MARVKALIDEVSADWHPSRWFTTSTFWFPFVISLITIAAAVTYRPLFNIITGEDRLGENLQVVGWIVALVFCVLIGKNPAFPKSTRALFGVLAVGIFFVIGEEISWGQRIFGFQTPAELVEQNRQGESNLHNIYGVQDVFSWLMFVIGAYGVGSSLYAMKRFGSYASWSPLAKTLAPHPILISYFLLMFVWRFYRNLFEPPESLYFGVSEFGETTELVLSTAFALLGWKRFSMRESELHQPALTTGDSAS